MWKFLSWNHVQGSIWASLMSAMPTINMVCQNMCLRLLCWNWFPYLLKLCQRRIPHTTANVNCLFSLANGNYVFVRFLGRCHAHQPMGGEVDCCGRYVLMWVYWDYLLCRVGVHWKWMRIMSAVSPHVSVCVQQNGSVCGWIVQQIQLSFIFEKII